MTQLLADLNPHHFGISSVAQEETETDSLASSAIATPRAPRKAKAPQASGIAMDVKMGAVTPISVMAVVNRTPARKKRMKKASA